VNLFMFLDIYNINTLNAQFVFFNAGMKILLIQTFDKLFDNFDNFDKLLFDYRLLLYI